MTCRRTSPDVTAHALASDGARYSREVLTEPPRLATQQVIEFLAGAAVPSLVNAAGPVADRTLEAGALAPVPTPWGGL